MVLLPPEGGFTSTFVPYNAGQNEKILDHVCLSRGVIGRFCIEKEWVIASGHLALNLEVRCTDLAGTSFEPEAENTRDPRRFVKRHRRRAPRRRRPGWREEVAGQFAALLPDGVCGIRLTTSSGGFSGPRGQHLLRKGALRGGRRTTLWNDTSSKNGEPLATGTRDEYSPNGFCR